MGRRFASILVLAAFPILVATAARADVIDGDWCSPQGGHMSIRGPQIVTPSGTALEGNYSRHYFTYVVPPSDPGAGQTVAMTLVNEETVHLRRGADPAAAEEAPVQVWHRCAPTVSRSERAAPPARG